MKFTVRALLATGLIACVSCSDDGAKTLPTPSGGWSIAPEGDLNSFFDCIAAEGAALVAAHRGGPYPGYPENAIETMEALFATTPALVELDVATSKDGVMFLLHDPTFERTTTGAGDVEDLTWNEIKALRLEDDDGAVTKFSPPRFDEVLAWAKGRTIVEIDIKPSTAYEDIAAEVNRQHAEDRVILLAFTLAQAEKLHRLMPKVMIALTIKSQSELNRAVAAGIPADRLLGFTGIEEPRPRLNSILEGSAVEVIFGTLGGSDSIDRQIARSGEERRYAAIAAMGVDLIATDRPREAHEALVEAGRAPRDGACGVQHIGAD